MLEKIKQQLADSNARLVAVSKTHPSSKILDLYEKGQRIFGENKAQEVVEKQEALPKDIEWHFIGHLQRNKVKYIAPFIHTIHSIDSLRLLKEINKQAAKHQRVVHCLLQFHIAQEDSKFGLDMVEAKAILDDPEYQILENVKITGVMGMATYTDKLDQVRSEFTSLKLIFDQLKESYFQEADDFKEISMGMSGDYELAVAEGSTLVRIGSLLFGARHYG